MTTDPRWDGLLDTQEVARILGVHVQTVRRYIRSKQLPAIRLTPRLYKVRQVDLERFLKARHTTATGSSGSGA
ncbi:MAG: helix-turn-helix domain-containing protein [Chloroflexota bacterium]|nr:helix-turn-helix domain-containing protein [Chloroflexota bacterium]